MSLFKILLAILSLFLGACHNETFILQGGSEVGNPPERRAVAGEVSDGSEAQELQFSCFADRVIATSQTTESLEITVTEACRFEGELLIGETYSFELMRDSEFVAVLMFEEEGLTELSPELEIPYGTDTLDLGRFMLEESDEGFIAIPWVSLVEFEWDPFAPENQDLFPDPEPTQLSPLGNRNPLSL